MCPISFWIGSSSSCDTTRGAFSLPAQCDAELNATRWHLCSGGRPGPQRPLLSFSAFSWIWGKWWGSSILVFLDFVFRRWDGNSNVLGCDGNTSLFDQAGKFLRTNELCHHYQKWAAPWALIGMLLYSRTVNRYICSSQTFLFSLTIWFFLLLFLANSLIKLNSLRGIAVKHSFLIN